MNTSLHAKVVSHGRYVTFQIAEVAVARQVFKGPCGSSRDCGRGPHRREGHRGQMQQKTTTEVRLD